MFDMIRKNDEIVVTPGPETEVISDCPVRGEGREWVMERMQQNGNKVRVEIWVSAMVEGDHPHCHIQISYILPDKAAWSGTPWVSFEEGGKGKNIPFSNVDLRENRITFAGVIHFPT